LTEEIALLQGQVNDLNGTRLVPLANLVIGSGIVIGIVTAVVGLFGIVGVIGSLIEGSRDSMVLSAIIVVTFGPLGLAIIGMGWFGRKVFKWSARKGAVQKGVEALEASLNEKQKELESHRNRVVAAKS
jgi:hypothetical protein